MRKRQMLYNWGVNNADYSVTKTGYVNGKRKIIWMCPIYKDWCSILERCFCIKTQTKRPTYMNCTICEEWKYFMNFRDWVLNVQPNENWQNCEPDKDVLYVGNKIYSPDTVIYVSSDVNKFPTTRENYRGDLFIGVSPVVSRKNPFQASCSNPFTSKLEYIGVFSTELEAHKAWQAKKHEHALRLAEEQEDPRVAKALRERYAPDKDWTNK